MNNIPPGPNLSQPVSARLPIICEQQLKGEDLKDIHGNYALRASIVKKNISTQLAAAKQIYVACQCPHATPGQIVMQQLPILETLSSSGSPDQLLALACQMNALTDMIFKWENITYPESRSKLKRELPTNGLKVLELILFPIAVELTLHLNGNDRHHATDATAYITSHLSPSVALKCTGEFILPLSHTTQEEHRVVAVQLLGAVCCFLPRNQTSSTLVAELSFACDDQNAALRIAAAAVFSQISACVDTKALAQRIFPLYVNLQQDKIWSIRQSALLAAPTLSRSADAMTSASTLLPALVRIIGELGQASKIALASVVMCCSSLPVLPPLIPLLLHRFLTSPNMTLYPRLAAVLPAFLSTLVNHPVTALTTERRRVVRGGEHPFYANNNLPTPTENDQESIYTVKYPQANVDLVDKAFTYAFPPDIYTKQHNPADEQCDCISCYLQVLIKMHYRLLVIERPLQIISTSVKNETITDIEAEQNIAMQTFYNSIGSFLSIIPNPLLLFVLSPILTSLTTINNHMKKLLLPQIGHMVCETPVYSRYMSFLGAKVAYASVLEEYNVQRTHPFMDWAHSSKEGLFIREQGDEPCTHKKCRCAEDEALTQSCENYHYYINDGLIKYYGDVLQNPASSTSEHIQSSDQQREDLGCISINPARLHLDKASSVFTDVTAITCAVPTIASVLIDEVGDIPWRAGVTVARQLGLLTGAAAGVDSYWSCRGFDTSLLLREEFPEMSYLHPVQACPNSRPPSAVALLTMQVLYMLNEKHTLRLRLETAQHAGCLIACAVNMSIAECKCVSKHPSTDASKDCIYDQGNNLCKCITHPDPDTWHQLPWYLWLQCIRKLRKSPCQPHQLSGTSHTRVFLSLISSASTFVAPVVYSQYFLLPVIYLLRHEAASIRLEALQIVQKILSGYHIAFTKESQNMTDKCLCKDIREYMTQPIGFIYPRQVPELYTCLACQVLPLMHTLATTVTTFDCTCVLGCDLQDFNALSTRCSPLGIAVRNLTPLKENSVNNTSNEDETKVKEEMKEEANVITVALEPQVSNNDNNDNDDMSNNIVEELANADNDNHNDITDNHNDITDNNDITDTNDTTDSTTDGDTTNTPNEDIITTTTTTSSLEENMMNNVYEEIITLNTPDTTDLANHTSHSNLLEQPNASVLAILLSLYLERNLDCDLEILYNCHCFETTTVAKADLPVFTQYPPFHTLFSPMRYNPKIHHKPMSLDAASGIGDVVLAHLSQSQNYYDGAESPPPLSPSSLPSSDLFGVSCAVGVSCGTPKLNPPPITNYTRAGVTLAFGKAPCGCGASGCYPIAMYEYALKCEEHFTGHQTQVNNMMNAFLVATIRSDITELISWPLQIWVAIHAIAHRHGLSENNIDNLYNVDFISAKPVNIGHLAFDAFQNERNWYHTLGTDDINEQDTVDIWAQCIYPVVVHNNSDDEDEEQTSYTTTPSTNNTRSSRANSKTTPVPLEDDESIQKDILNVIKQNREKELQENTTTEDEVFVEMETIIESVPREEPLDVISPEQKPDITQPE